VVFFFSSRRRHTRCLSDWSSDVCSSDLTAHMLQTIRSNFLSPMLGQGSPCQASSLYLSQRPAHEKANLCSERVQLHGSHHQPTRSEERRVGKECRTWCGTRD